MCRIPVNSYAYAGSCDDQTTYQFGKRLDVDENKTTLDSPTCWRKQSYIEVRYVWDYEMTATENPFIFQEISIDNNGDEHIFMERPIWSPRDINNPLKTRIEEDREIDKLNYHSVDVFDYVVECIKKNMKNSTADHNEVKLLYMCGKINSKIYADYISQIE